MGTGMEIDRGPLARTRSRESLRALRGKLRWEGSLDEMRLDRPAPARAGRSRPRRPSRPKS